MVPLGSHWYPCLIFYLRVTAVGGVDLGLRTCLRPVLARSGRYTYNGLCVTAHFPYLRGYLVYNTLTNLVLKLDRYIDRYS